MINEYIVVRNNKKAELKVVNSYEMNEHVDIIDDFDVLFNQYMDVGYLDSERVYVISLDNNNNILGINLVSIGNNQSCYVYNRSIGIFLLLTAADKFALLHNHPNGKLIESDDDIKITESMLNLGNLIGINFSNNYILTSNGIYDVITKEGIQYEEEEF